VAQQVRHFLARKIGGNLNIGQLMTHGRSTGIMRYSV
jgi:hypothetical protein